MKKSTKKTTDQLEEPNDELEISDYDAYLSKISESGKSELPSWEYRKKYDINVLIEHLESLSGLDRQLDLLYKVRAEYKRDGEGLRQLVSRLGTINLKLLLEASDSNLNDELNALIGFGNKLDAEIEMYEGRLRITGVDERDDKDRYDPKERGLTAQLAMLLLDELFPSTKDAALLAKAEFLELLVGWNKDKLRNKWGDIQYGNPASLAKDREKVEYWRRRLKIKD
ncbi:MAG: hypothetical protein IPM50_05330 [Acidobacteriota bacterium]|nr:MAG: hypothetical protein IPM50_05330 [Acidobacteriota bacterium]